jgi:copper(I)-binding protein
MRRTCLMVPLVLIALTGCSKKADSGDKVENLLLGVATGSAEATDSPVSTTGLTLANATVQLPAVPGRPAVAYFTLTVGDAAKGKLVAVHVDHFARAEMHVSKMEGATMTMSPVDALALIPGKPIVFAPGGYHVMLFDGDGVLKPGSHTAITLTLDNGDTISAQAQVTAPAGGEGM